MSKQRFLQKRLESALFFGGLAGLIAFVLAGLVFWGKDDIPLYSGFPEWNSRPGDTCLCGDDETVAASEDDGELAASLGEHFDNMGRLIRTVINDFVFSQEERHVAGLVRTYSVVVVFLSLLWGYRRLLGERYAVDDHPAQLKVFRQRPEIRRAGRLAVAASATATSYVLISALWIVAADMFEDLTLTYLGAVIVTGLFVGTVCFLMIYWSTAATTRDIVVFGLLSFGIGMAGGFAIAGQVVRNGQPMHWWQVAVSAAGRSPGAELFFMFTLVSLAITLYILWIDLRDLVRQVLPQDKAVAPFLKKRVFRNKLSDADVAYQSIRIPYLFSLFCIASVGLFPLIEQGNTLTLIVTGILHTLTASVAMLMFIGGGMVILTRWLPDELFPPHFKWLSQFVAAICLGLAVLFAYSQASENQILSLTALELIYFVVMSVWIFGAVDNLLRYADRLSSFDAMLRAFWVAHPPDDGWRIVTALDNDGAVNATIMHQEDVIATGTAPQTDDDALRTALRSAIETLQPQPSQ